ncbi:NAD(P)H-hydrate dehydratase [Ramlibacter sp. AW1]|uniref:Bifunctional NAD(P)H-hydrate repair enzyme n=1 Tax=Ramlibacter aurantiacus TaxID=2801330 RepID=A0A936ZN51_9BURK|nr:NAD(P)H-hydrate dehydratase [Ramlibacter aurantiacus]MBL0420363.1 NAD(P)H-hydrate dehydratase [Ramlibacter aurantiacus]
MERVTPEREWPLHDVASLRRIEAEAAASLSPHTLMQRAGLASARLALALAPHARNAWIACGPGNNGGDGFEAAFHLKTWGLEPVVTWLGTADRLPTDARASLQRAQSVGVAIQPDPPARYGIAIDALFGIGSRKPLEGTAARWRERLSTGGVPVLAIDVPSGLDADTGRGLAVRATHTLTLLALKPGLFTAGGRDAAGEVWFDDLGVAGGIVPPVARLAAEPAVEQRAHASHKGSWGDVAVIGGAPGMRGAALLAATAALHGGAGRVYVGLLDGDAGTLHGQQPDLMFRDPDRLDLDDMHVACGCGGGDAVRARLPRVLEAAASLVLDADALNAIAADPALQEKLRDRGEGRPTVLTPHPLEAARLLQVGVDDVQRDRLQAARLLGERLGCCVVLKGSGTVVAAPGALPHVNPTGNARLAVAGTGDVLAGMIAARLAAGRPPLAAACEAVFAHGRLADRWPAGSHLTAAELARAVHLPGEVSLPPSGWTGAR